MNYFSQPSKLAIAIALTWSFAAHAGDGLNSDLSLTKAITAAQAHDKSYLAQSTAQDTADALRMQADSLWRPQVMATGTIAKADNTTKVADAQFAQAQMGSFTGANFNTDIDHGTMTQWAVSAKQPLFNLARRAQSAQLNLAADMNALQKSGADQALIIRTAEQYFDVQLAQQKLQLLSAQLKATEKFAEEAKYRYDIGNRPITEVHEAQAQLAQFQAQHLGAQSDLQVKLQRLHDAIGNLPASIPNTLHLSKNPPALGALNTWLEKAKSGNLELQSSALNVQMAQARANEYTTGASAALDLVAQFGRQKLSGNGDYGNASNRENQGMVGLQLTVPLYTGGYNDGKYREMQVALKRAQLDYASAQERISQQIKATYLGAQTAERQVAALTRALIASESRLGATKTGQEVGHRTLLDVMNAQNQTTDVRINLEATKEQYVLARLRLAAMVQEASPELVRQLVAQ